MVGRLGVGGAVSPPEDAGSGATDMLPPDIEGRLGVEGPMVPPIIPVPVDATAELLMPLVSGLERVSLRDAFIEKVIQPLRATPFRLM